MNTPHIWSIKVEKLDDGNYRLHYYEDVECTPNEATRLHESIAPGFAALRPVAIHVKPPQLIQGSRRSFRFEFEMTTRALRPLADFVVAEFLPHSLLANKRLLDLLTLVLLGQGQSANEEAEATS